ncbi:thioesterase family protein [Candidatus Poriferisodalis sp.]|uniref:thioesterase family protein n=1 Tax=Candidatus Poriferisodalis sp. TaxID=3101277 RepID=UPI003B01AC08
MSEDLLSPQPTDEVLPAPVEVLRGTVQEQWIDYNGHLNAGYYLVAFDDAIAPWMDFIGLGTAHRAVRDITTFSAQNHITYVQEIGPDEPYVITVQLLGFDRKRVHAFQSMIQTRDDFVAATCEVMSLNIDGPTRRVAPMDDEPFGRLSEIWAVHRELELPPGAGRSIAIPATEEASRHPSLI